MPMQERYLAEEPSLAEVTAMAGPLLLEFGTPWCGYCISVQSSLAMALAEYDEVLHLKIEDGRGRRLGRAFRVKLWPTLVFLRDGEELERLVRPSGSAVIRAALSRIAA
ncbi:thioredoxin family protein [Halomonas sp. E19]|uniref:thioredoxin family protein n=1 Tax=Halomonas sp. E19 TaxID=3397247 RepID=UPI0040340313